ncbi:hypothetical protein NSK_007479 [Nannochloropsis salina CCMP1776]|uniref:Uncharacterized protein n=1 Tax=Nannochloropsis salina CCMP1776 TaxID=1027361 RepID=A0A4D9CX89_9STRA|nr:hypothetical protein NSK_007479 [Nannochloropsis salina CCMP1776]|eukprot:TFJ81189.1 hypothetical protein NSK_007479 [Nannochloropsis salina CCMP1776]
MEVSQKMEIEKKRKRLESLTQSLEEERRGENDTHVDGDIHPLILEAASLSSSIGQWDRLALEAHHLKKIGAMARQEGEEGVWEECEERIKGLEKECAAFRTQVRVLPCAPKSSAPSPSSTTTSTPLPADSLLGDPLKPAHEDEKCADKSQQGAREGEEGREALCRTYVLYPHALIKDHRTGLTAEGSKAEDVLEKGDIDAFIEAALTQASMTKSEEDKGGRIGSIEEEAKLKYVGGKESSEDDREDVIEKIGENQDNDEKREGTEGDATEDERDEEQE